MNPIKAAQDARQLGADVMEELEAFREAQRERRMLELDVETVFANKGWR